MADVEVVSADITSGRVKSLKVRFKGTTERVIDRDTALRWLADGHSLLTYAGTGHHAVRGKALERVEVDDEAFIRCDTQKVSEDQVVFPQGH